MAERAVYVRIARVCPKPDCGFRRFFETEQAANVWRCPDHNQAVVQEDRPYPGKAYLRALAGPVQ